MGLPFFLCTCGAPAVSGEHETTDDYYIVQDKRYQEIFTDLFELLSSEVSYGEEQFSIVREIANEYARIGEYGKLVNFLSYWVEKHPDDPYNAYHLFMIAYAYMQQEAYPVAALYFDLIIKNYPDLSIRGESIHLACLKQLIELGNKPDQRVWYYQELISRFSDNIDLGTAYFMLAQAYEAVGDWDAAIQNYTKFLPYYHTQIPGFPDAFGYAKQLVDFNNSPKDWTFESLSALVTAIKSAVNSGSSTRLERTMAKVNFFARSWEQEDEDNSGMAEFNLSDFMRGNRIRYADDLDESSNANEAYLRTWGWSQRISIWYLYFRKIYFPSDPEIHGRWEWAGVYYGEKF
ncbi:tetratricopeptide repeat protein [Breznakiella homolactica]|uniref:Tetratricopeptide repeat protein n=1 Tax=Breznakiella homolactica TaxID=2798577 RepID=A0A7T7XRY4_9SPIR|nr:tetratricopeptide repeat protein [Breznakiella homolactica]